MRIHKNSDLTSGVTVIKSLPLQAAHDIELSCKSNVLRNRFEFQLDADYRFTPRRSVLLLACDTYKETAERMGHLITFFARIHPRYNCFDVKFSK
jgi:hypothetical protein